MIQSGWINTPVMDGNTVNLTWTGQGKDQAKLLAEVIACFDPDRPAVSLVQFTREAALNRPNTRYQRRGFPPKCG